MAKKEVIKIKLNLKKQKTEAIRSQRFSDLQNIINPPPKIVRNQPGFPSRTLSIYDLIDLSGEDKLRFFEVLTKEYEVDIDINGL